MEYPVYKEAIDQYDLQQVMYPDRIDEIGRLRFIAWQTEKGFNAAFFSSGYWIDELDKVSFLWVITHHDKIIASARLSIHKEIGFIPWNDYIPTEARDKIIFPAASINRLVVHPAYRKKGLSHPLDKVRIEKAKEENAQCIIAEPVSKRHSVLKEIGFEDYGEFGSTPELPGVDLGFMIMHLKA